MLEELDALRVVQTVASEAYKAWLPQTLRSALVEASSRLEVGGDYLQVDNVERSVGVAGRL